MRIKIKEWKIEAKHKSTRRKLKKLANTQRRRLEKDRLEKEWLTLSK